jgi:hypothetical protein
MQTKVTSPDRPPVDSGPKHQVVIPNGCEACPERSEGA